MNEKIGFGQILFNCKINGMNDEFLVQNGLLIAVIAQNIQ